MSDRLVVRGAREHNLKNISVDLPRDKMIVFTGLSGSGKSSLAFDTIYAEGQRRYVESLSAYARQFLGQMDKPDVDVIEGLSPSDFHRSEIRKPQPPLDGGDHHRGVRLSALALRAHRTTALSHGRNTLGASNTTADRGPRADLDGGNQVSGVGAGGARSQG